MNEWERSFAGNTYTYNTHTFTIHICTLYNFCSKRFLVNDDCHAWFNQNRMLQKLFESSLSSTSHSLNHSRGCASSIIRMPSVCDGEPSKQCRHVQLDLPFEWHLLSNNQSLTTMLILRCRWILLLRFINVVELIIVNKRRWHKYCNKLSAEQQP